MAVRNRFSCPFIVALLFQCLRVVLVVLHEICTLPRAQMYDEQNSPNNRVYFSNSDGTKTVDKGGAQIGPFGQPKCV